MLDSTPSALLSRANPLILSHRGALGDFLVSWPALRALVLARPRARTLWAGRAEYHFFLEPLGAEKAGPELTRAVDRAYGNDPSGLPGSAVLVRFALAPGRTFPEHLQILSIYSVDPESFDPPGLIQAETLARWGVPLPPGALADFQGFFGHVPPGPEESRALAACAGEAALLFPGAGHPAKAWPLVQYFELAQRLPELGLCPVFVLGPAEVERGMDARGWPDEWPTVRPQSLSDLTGLLNRAALVLGNDSGPLHLAGMLRRPAVALFGPSSRRQWGPPGVLALARDMSRDQACRPCTRTTVALDCAEPVCLSEMKVEEVLEALTRIRTASQSGGHTQKPGSSRKEE